MRKLNELNRKELVKVFENNSKLREKVFNDMFENADFWNGEYLDCWKRGAISYSIGWDRGTFFRILNEDLFLDGLEKAQKDFGFLADQYNETIKYCRELVERFDNISYNLSMENEERMRNRIDELLEELENACYKRFMEEYEYCFDTDNQKEYFIDFFSSERLDENFYINEDFELFEHVEFVRNYA